jgi:ammonium transporter, Amt family
MEATINTGDTAWILVSAALVMLMTPGLAFFYAGLVRSKNVISTIMHCFVMLGLCSVIWVLWGYSLAFGSDVGGAGLIGSLEYFGLRNVGLEPGPYADTIPHQLFMVFQLMFAVITPALIIGAFAERIKFSALLIFTVIWLTIVYAPMAHWVWGDGGWLQNLWGEAALDFAGGTVVHVNAGMAALAAAIIFGRRIGYGKEPMEPHNVTYVVLGTALLWFGWFGFNAGSALESGALAVNAFVVTHVAAASAALTWLFLTWWLQKKPSAVGAATGAVAGLVAVTPAAGFIGAWPGTDGYLNSMPAILLGIGAGVVTYGAVHIRIKLNLDDSLDVWGVHGVGGAWGALATGIFAVAAIGGTAGLIDGAPGQLLRQLVGIGAAAAYAFILTLIIFKAIDLVIGIRVTEDDERLGLDVSQHGERGYVFEESGAVPEYVASAALETAPTPQTGTIGQAAAGSEA